MTDIKEVLKDARFVDTDIKQPPPVITIQGKTIATESNFIVISGLPKSRKTTFAFLMLAAAFARRAIFDIEVKISPTDKVLLIDTEQSIYDFARQIKVFKSFIQNNKLPENFDAYLFRKYEPDTILKSIYELMQQTKPKILILDNLTELVMNVNDVIESKNAIQFLKKITAEFNCVVICLLHLNKSNLNTLGNLGSFADRGAQSVLKVTKEKETEISYLEADRLRSAGDFEPIGIYYNQNTNQYEKTNETPAPKPVKKADALAALTPDEHKVKLSLIFTGNKSLTYAELVEDLRRYYGVGITNVKQKLIPLILSINLVRTSKGIYQFNF
jgi:KaiC/GvpD/RAD55 family RecA-like ATPase